MKKRKRSVTQKQENFAQAVVAGMSRIEAYQLHYDTKSQSKAALNTMSARIANSEAVKARIAELRDVAAENLLWTQEMSVRKLTDILDDPEATHDVRLRAIKQLNDLFGWGGQKETRPSQSVSIMGDIIIDTGIRREMVTIDGKAENTNEEN